MSATIISEALPSNHPVDATPTPTNLPRLVVDSPSPIPSPRRSPGTTSVLLALRLIDHDDPDVAGNKSIATSQPDEASPDTREVTPWSEALPTLVNEGFPVVDGPLEGESYYTDDDTDDYAGNWTAISDYNDLSPQSLSQYINQEGVENSMPLVDDDTEGENTVHDRVSSHPESDAQPSFFEVTQSRPVDPSPHASVGLLSPIELSTLNLGPFRLDDNVVTEDGNSFDSGYAETWKPPNPLLPSPPRSPSISSTFDLLSSPFGTLSSRIVSPYLGAFLARSPMSPARTISPAMLDEVPPLDLGLGSPEGNTSPPLVCNFDNKSCPSPHSSSNDQDLADVSDSQVEDIKDEPLDEGHLLDHEDSYDASIWDPEGGPTAVFVGPDENHVREQVTAAIRRQSRSSPLHFLHSQDTNLVGDDPLDHSLDSTDDEGASTSQPPSEPVEEEYDGSQISLDSDTTTFLAYLKSSPRNDTLTSLYDIYSDIAPSKDVISDSIRNAGLSPPKPPATTLSNTSSPASSLRGRVFTPPPSREERSGALTADSSASLSPITSINPSSVGRSSPFSVPDDRRHPSGRTGSQSSQDEASKKVPFGFRQSFTLVSLIPTLLQMRHDMPS